MALVAIKKNELASKEDPELRVSIAWEPGEYQEVVTRLLNPREHPGKTLVDTCRGIALSKDGTRLVHGDLDLSPLFEYLGTVSYMTDEGFADTEVEAYSVRVVPKPGLYSLDRNGLTPFARIEAPRAKKFFNRKET